MRQALQRLGLEGVATHSAIYLAARVVPAVLAVASVPVFIRLLGTDRFGRYALYLALALVAGSTAAAWVAQPVLRFQSRFIGSPQYSRVVRRARWEATAAVALVVGMGGLALPADAWAHTGAVILAASVVWSSVSFARLQAALDAGGASGMEVLRVGIGVGLALAVVLVVGRREPGDLLLCTAVGNVAAVAWASRRGRSGGPVHQRQPGRERVLSVQFARYGAPLALWLFAALALNSIDRYLIERALGVGAVGSYAAVYDLVFKGVEFCFVPLLLAATPQVVAAWNRNDIESASRTLRSTFWVAAGVAVVGTTVAWTLGPLALGAIVPDVPRSTAALAGPIAAGCFLWQLAMVVQKPLELARRTGPLLWAVGGALVLNVGLNVALLPTVGVRAAAYATIASGTAYLLAVWAVGRGSMSFLPVGRVAMTRGGRGRAADGETAPVLTKGLPA
jgi:O-antigen/teichoic acid export membrane protein